ncbi:MAG: hypothetical protein EZS28_001194 [Streblomastix strix]|uniref:Uncharacterized protein n=1 Tax=Streblomastix strix TaxID=222440 RepID=A0A5J4X8R6_9EUKA|nr:MAG: hypothetical protein EZS28_001194 [Streblomastix strix]
MLLFSKDVDKPLGNVAFPAQKNLYPNIDQIVESVQVSPMQTQKSPISPSQMISPLSDHNAQLPQPFKSQDILLSFATIQYEGGKAEQK